MYAVWPPRLAIALSSGLLISFLDWQTNATPESITKTVMDHITNGAIILMHAGSQVESETLDGLMTKIEQMGYQPVTVTQVLQ